MPNPSTTVAAAASAALRRHAVALALWLGSGVLVLLSGYFLAPLLPLPSRLCAGHRLGYTSWLSNWDGQWYQLIADHGYHYEGAGGYTPLVFFPLYPLLGRLLDLLTPMHGQLPLVALSWLATLAFVPVWMRYAQARIAPPSPSTARWGLALVLFWPVSYFLRVAYTEALYLFLLTLFFCGCAQRWRPAALVLIAGLLTATRPTGVLVCVVLGLHLFLRWNTLPPGRRLLQAGALAALSAWGLYAYMAYLQIEFGDALLFVHKQAAWNRYTPSGAFFERWAEMLSLRPAWGFLVDGSLSHPEYIAWDLQNRLSWLLGFVLVIVAFARRWLSAEELLFCVLTLALVYVTHGPKHMESIGRYVATLVPLYLVLTRLLVALPVPGRVVVIGMSAGLLAVQSASFRLWGCTF